MDLVIAQYDGRDNCIFGDSEGLDLLSGITDSEHFGSFPSQLYISHWGCLLRLYKPTRKPLRASFDIA